MANKCYTNTKYIEADQNCLDYFRMMKQVGSDLDVHALCHGLMQPWPVMAEQHEALKEVWLKQVRFMSNADSQLN